jgi:hypothetical protein
MMRSGLREFLRRHGLGEQESLRQIEAYLAYGDKIGARLDSFSDGAGPQPVGKVDNLAAYALL